MKLRRAFTLIEILVSVVLISIVVMGIVEIRQQNIEAIHYLDSRMQEELGNTLFLGSGASLYRGSRKDAYSLLSQLGIGNSKTRELLKQEVREIQISDPLPVGKLPLPIVLRAIQLRGRYPSRYYRLHY